MNLVGSVSSSKTSLLTPKSAEIWGIICFMLKKLGSRYLFFFFFFSLLSVNSKEIELKQTKLIECYFLGTGVIFLCNSIIICCDFFSFT